MALQKIADSAMKCGMTCDIFYRSYKNDFEWLGYSLKSVNKFASGFNRVHIAVPTEDLACVPSVHGEGLHIVHDNCEGYMGQQITKLHADEFCEADYVAHLDSDCILEKKLYAGNLFINGKPVYLREDGTDSPWIDIAAVTLGWRDSNEYMRRLPIVYPRWIYLEFRNWIEKKHGMSLDNWVAIQPSRRFSEFQSLGQWAYEYHRDAFHWMHPSEFPAYVSQFWSWGGITPEIKEKIDNILAS